MMILIKTRQIDIKHADLTDLRIKARELKGSLQFIVYSLEFIVYSLEFNKEDKI